MPPQSYNDITPTTNQRILHRSDLYDESEAAELEQPPTDPMTPSISYVIHNLPHTTENPEAEPQTTAISTIGNIRNVRINSGRVKANVGRNVNIAFNTRDTFVSIIR